MPVWDEGLAGILLRFVPEYSCFSPSRRRHSGLRLKIRRRLLMRSSVSSVFPSWAGKRPSENQIQGFQTALIIAEVMYGQIYRRMNGKTPVDTGIALIFFRKFRCPAGAIDFVGSGIRSGSLFTANGSSAEHQFFRPAEERPSENHSSRFQTAFFRFTSLPIQIRTSRESRRLRPRRFSRRRGLWAGRAFSSCCRTGRR